MSKNGRARRFFSPERVSIRMILPLRRMTKL
jgi:hypothetical protein